MKLKTAKELLDTDGCGECSAWTQEDEDAYCKHDLELVARRAREEAFEMAAKVVEEGVREVGTEPCGLGPDECDSCKREAELVARIRALPTEPK